MNVAGMRVYFASELKKYGVTEDGEDFIGEIFFVEVEDVKGNRWRHHNTYNGVRPEYNEFGSYFADTRDWARMKCQSIVDAIAVTGRINLNRWSQARPAYGSEAYVEYGQADDLAWEKAQE